MPISCPASATIFVCSGKVSIECPGMNQVVLSPFRSNSFSSRGDPTSPAKRPREMSSGESSPPYEPSQPATASTSTPNPQRISFAIFVSPPLWPPGRCRLNRTVCAGNRPDHRRLGRGPGDQHLGTVERTLIFIARGLDGDLLAVFQRNGQVHLESGHGAAD